MNIVDLNWWMKDEKCEEEEFRTHRKVLRGEVAKDKRFRNGSWLSGKAPL